MVPGTIPLEGAVGLDGVELLMAIEERFQIAIADEDAVRMTTPGDIVTHVLARLGVSTSSHCLEQRAFYRLRRASVHVFGLPRHAIKPGTLWKDVLPPRSRRRNWELLHAATATSAWPGLTLLAKVPDDIATVAATARRLAELCPAAFKAPGEGWSRQVVEEAVRMIVCQQLGITGFEWDDELVADLGLD